MKLPSLQRIKEMPMLGRVVNTSLGLTIISALVGLFGSEQVAEWINFFIGME